jgi:hypothetical protein
VRLAAEAVVVACYTHDTWEVLKERIDELRVALGYGTSADLLKVLRTRELNVRMRGHD